MKSSSPMFSISPELAEVIVEAYKRESDPLAVIVSHAYFFSGLSINAIRNLIVISDTFGVLRIPSKELIRRMISSVRNNILAVTYERYGGNIPYELFMDVDSSSIMELDSVIRSIDQTEDTTQDVYAEAF